MLGFNDPASVQHYSITSPSGVVYHDLLPGEGEGAMMGDLITIEYTAYLPDGTRIDSTHDRGRPIQFELGDAPLAGWNEGLVTMRTGGKRRLEVPAALAYGSQGVPDLVPPDTALVFDIELVAIDEQQATATR